jgi:hypothetical protein
MPQSQRSTTETDRRDEERRQEQTQRNQAALEMLHQWDQEDPDEQRETWEFLKRALDEDRPGQRQLFP